MRNVSLYAFLLFIGSTATSINPLYEFDSASYGFEENAIYLSGGFDYGKEYYTDTVFSIYQDYKQENLYIPLKISYAINKCYLFGLLLPAYKVSYTHFYDYGEFGTSSDNSSNFDFSNPWVFLKAFLFSTGDGVLILNERLGGKIPYGPYSLENQMGDYYTNYPAAQKPITGDRNITFNLGTIYGLYPKGTAFILDGQVDFNYSLNNTYYYPRLTYYDPNTGNKSSVEESAQITPSKKFDLFIEPGFNWGLNKQLSTHIILEYHTSLNKYKSIYIWNDGNSHRDEYNIKDSNIFSLGVKQDFTFDRNNKIMFKIIDDMSVSKSNINKKGFINDNLIEDNSYGINVNKGWYISLGYIFITNI